MSGRQLLTNPPSFPFFSFFFFLFILKIPSKMNGKPIRVSSAVWTFMALQIRFICAIGPLLVWRTVSVAQNFEVSALRAPLIAIFSLWDMVLPMKAHMH